MRDIGVQRKRERERLQNYFWSSSHLLGKIENRISIDETRHAKFLNCTLLESAELLEGFWRKILNMCKTKYWTCVRLEWELCQKNWERGSFVQSGCCTSSMFTKRKEENEFQRKIWASFKSNPTDFMCQFYHKGWKVGFIASFLHKTAVVAVVQVMYPPVTSQLVFFLGYDRIFSTYDFKIVTFTHFLNRLISWGQIWVAGEKIISHQLKEMLWQWKS